MMRVVLDTNCLIMAISAQNEYFSVWQGFLDGKYTLCITNEIIEEYAEVMARNLSPLISEYIITAILNRRNVHRISPCYAFHLIETDEDDNKFVDCAIIAGAKYIVTHDHHFNILKQIPFPKVDIVTLKQFLDDLNQLDTHP